MRNLLYLILLIPYLSLSQEIVCSDTSCDQDSDFTLDEKIDYSSYTILKLTSNVDEISINTPDGEKNRDLMLSLFNSQEVDYSIDLKSSLSSSDAGNLIVFTNRIDELDINLDGLDGQNYTDSSVTCATNIKAGLYGSDALSMFNALRSGDPSISEDNCVEQDLLNIQTLDHTCDTGESIPDSNSIVASRWIGKRTCHGDAARKMCIRKKMRLHCTYADMSTSEFVLWESEVDEFYGYGYSNADICDHLAGLF